MKKKMIVISLIINTHNIFIEGNLKYKNKYDTGFCCVRLRFRKSWDRKYKKKFGD